MTTSSERPQTPPDYRAIAEEVAEENERLTALARRLLGYLAQYTEIEKFEQELDGGR